MNFVITIIVLFALQYGLSYLFSLMGISPYVIDTLINLIFAFIFAFLFYRGDKKDAIKDIRFHRSVALYFVVLVGFSILWWILF